MNRTFLPALLLCLAAALPAAAGGPAPVALEPRSTVPPDVPQAALDARIAGDVVVSARVTRYGTVDSVRATSGDRRLRDAALDAVRWYLYAPQAGPVWTTATVHIDGTVDAPPLAVDVRARALEAERAGRIPDALDAWTGVLNRIGRHPTMRNPWPVRLHIQQLQRRLAAEPVIRGKSVETGISARIEQQRTVASDAHAELVRKFQDALVDMPWWADVYQWEAASLLASGRSGEAIRALLVFRAGARDTALLTLAERGLAGIAAGDTVATAELLKTGGKQYDSPDPEAGK